MKKKEIRELSQKTLEDLRLLLVETRKNLLKCLMETRGGKLKNSRLVSRLRDDLARIETFIGQKRLQEVK